MKKFVLWLSITIVLGVICSLIYGSIDRPRKFIDQAFEQMRSNKGSAKSETYQVDSGESFSVILEHSCCSGAGFDAVAIRTSAREEFSSTKNYCGLEGFAGYSIAEEVKNLSQLSSFLKKEGYKQH